MIRLILIILAAEAAVCAAVLAGAYIKSNERPVIALVARPGR